MVRVYVLIETEVGKTKRVIDTISMLEHVASVDSVTGPYDAIAIVECDTIAGLGECVTSKIHPIKGIARTVTCLAV